MGTGILVTESYFLICLILGLQDSQFRSCESKTCYHQHIQYILRKMIYMNPHQSLQTISQPSCRTQPLCWFALGRCCSKTVVRTAGRIDGWVSALYWFLLIYLASKIFIYPSILSRFLTFFTKGQLMPPDTDSKSSYELYELKRFGWKCKSYPRNLHPVR